MAAGRGAGHVAEDGGVAPFVEPVPGPWSRVAVAVVFLAGVAAAVVLVASGQLSLADVQERVRAQGAWAPVAYLVLFLLAALLALPGTAMIVVGALLFPFWMALALAWLGSVVGAAGPFLVARLLGRGFVRRLLGGRLARLDDRVAEKGFQVVLLLRLTGVPPYNLLNFASGLTRVRLAEYVAATALGVLPLVVAVVTVVHRIGTAPTLADVAGDPVLYAALGLVLLIVLVGRRFKRRMGARVASRPAAPGP